MKLGETELRRSERISEQTVVTPVDNRMELGETVVWRSPAPPRIFLSDRQIRKQFSDLLDPDSHDRTIPTFVFVPEDQKWETVVAAAEAEMSAM